MYFNRILLIEEFSVLIHLQLHLNSHNGKNDAGKHRCRSDKLVIAKENQAKSGSGINRADKSSVYYNQEFEDLEHKLCTKDSEYYSNDCSDNIADLFISHGDTYV